MPIGEQLLFSMKGGDARTVHILPIIRQLSVSIGLIELPTERGQRVEVVKLFFMNHLFAMAISDPEKG